MHKETFKVIDKYESLLTKLYFELEKMGIDMEKLNKLYDDFDDLKEQLFKLGKYIDEEKFINKNGFLKEEYEKLPKYLKLNILYEYENGYCLCKTTSGLIFLIPKQLIQENI